MARLERVRIYPVKGLDGVDVEATRVAAGGTLAHDREFVLTDADGEVVNGKRTPRVHDLDTDYDVDAGVLAVAPRGGERREFDLREDPGAAEAWFGDFFDLDLTLERDASLGYVDRRDMGPSVISTATIEAVASWFEDVTVEGARRRLRANLEVSGVPAFWEDRFVGDDAPGFRVGDVSFEGVAPCGRCVVPERDPETGEATERFRERFVEKRRETFPPWADEAAFDHLYATMILTTVPDADRGPTMRVGDEVEVGGGEAETPDPADA